MSARTRAVIILGMHRSGTSLIAKTMKSLGVYWGLEDQMIGPREDNPEGFWEHAGIVDIHEKLLNSMSSSWDAAAPLPQQWWQSDEAVAYREKLKDIVTGSFSNHALWGFKDPRTCLLLPLWQSIFEQLNVDPVYIICLRNPLNVAASLHKRDRFTREKSMALWAKYVLSSLYYTRSEQRIVVSYDRLLEQPVETGERISRFLNIASAERQMMRSLPNHTLRHGSYTANELWSMPAIPSIVKQLYQLGLSAENNEQELNSSAFNESVINVHENFEQTVQLLNHERAYRMQIYWAGADEQFAEQKSSYITVNPSGSKVSYQVEIREEIGSALRVNLLQEHTYVNISRLALVQENEEVNLLRSGNKAYAHFLVLHNDGAENTDAIAGVCIGSEPQLIIRDLPPLHGPVTLLIELSCSFQLNNELVKRLLHQRAVEEEIRAFVRASGDRIEQLRMINEEKEETIRSAADQFEKQLEMLELLMQEREAQEAGHRALHEELQRQRAEIADLQTRLSDKDKDRDKDKLSLNDSSRLVRQRDQEIERYRREIALYSQSLSWRATVPLRWLGETARKSTKRLRMQVKRAMQWYAIQQNRHQRSEGLASKMRYKKYALIISHTNYLESMGGTEKYIYEQSSYLAYNNVGVIQIYPGQSYSLLDTKDGTYYGVVADGYFRGFHSIADIGNWLSNLNIQLTKLYTHHLLNWQISDYMTLFKRAKERHAFSHVLFMHDFFALCSSYHMLYEPKAAVRVKQAGDRKPCIPEIVASTGTGADAPICQSCRHSAQLPEWRQANRSVLAQADQIIVPSEFVKETVVAVYSDIVDQIKVHSHLIFTKQKLVTKPRPQTRKLKLAYLGYRMDNKGWKLWERLYMDESLGQIYEFHHIGSQEDYADHVVMHRYSFIKDGMMGAPNLLIEHDIDIVLLWSIVPESYSYTLQEAVAAGVPVLTSPQSGNIAATIDSHPELGKVLHSEDKLREFLFNSETVRCYVSGDRARYALEYNYLPLD